MAFMFPTVMLVLNVSSVAAIWFGADRIGAGDMQIGALIAFLSYLIQILMSVMMATFVAMLTPRASVCAERIEEVLDTKSSVVPPAEPGHRARPAQLARAARRRVRVPGRRLPGALRHLVQGGRRPDDGDHRQHRRRQDHAAEPGAAAVRRDRRRGARRRGRRARHRARAALEPHRARPAEAVPLLRHRGEQPALRRPRRHRRRAVAGARDRAGPATSSRRCPAGSRRRSRRVARTSPAASASASPSPARSCAGPGIYLFDDSFSALDLATDARLRAALAPDHRRTRSR